VSLSWCTAAEHGLRLAVQVQPNAKKTEVTGLLDGALKIRLQAQPVEGQANEALVKFLANKLGVSKSAVRVTHGLTNRKKLVEVRSASLTPALVKALLGLP
jgi:uncharacterized protein (TIGR00251 family)